MDLTLPANRVRLRRATQVLAIPEAGTVITNVALIALFAAINPAFLGGANLLAILRAMAYPGIVAIGMGLCLICGVIDLSVGATAGLASVLFSYAAVRWHWSFPLAVGLALTGGALVGLMNGLVITRFRVTPFIMTICSMYALRGAASWISNGYLIYPLPAAFNKIGAAQPWGLSWAFIVMLGAMVVLWIVLDRTVWGLEVRAVGSDKEAAECTEVNVRRIQVSVFTLSGLLAGLAGVMVTFVLGAGSSTAGMGWELIAVAGCAIGGVSLFGYEGSMIGLFCGLLTLQVIQNGIVVIGVNPYAQTIVVGAILLAAMVLEVRRRRWLNLERI